MKFTGYTWSLRGGGRLLQVACAPPCKGLTLVREGEPVVVCSSCKAEEVLAFVEDADVQHREMIS